MNKSPRFRKNEPIKNRLKQARSLFQPVLEFLYSGWSEGRPASSRSGSDIPKRFQLLQYPAELPLRDIAHIRKGLEQLLQTIQKVRRQINPKLKIEGILMTMTDSRTNYGREIDALIRQVYGS